MSTTKDSVSNSDRIKSIHLDDEELSSILDRLDRESAKFAGENKRSSKRYSYSLKGLAIDLHQPGGSTDSFLVPTRNISRKGLTFLHAGFVHIGTECRAQLVTTCNMWRTVKGRVRHCRHIEGRVHEVGIEFDQAIDVATFSPEAVHRRVLVVDDDPSIRRLSCFHLKRMNVDVSTAEDGQAAVDTAMSNAFDCILMDVDMPVLDGLGAVAALRKRGYGGRIVAATALTSPGDRDRLLAAGFSGYIAKPITKESLASLLDGFNQEPLFSSLADELGMDELINEFVKELALQCRAIEDAFARSDLGALERRARSLKGEAGGYGFEPITNAARQIEEAAGSASEPSELQKLVAELTALCCMARPTEIQAEPDSGP